MKYKPKIQQLVIDSSKLPQYYIKDEAIILNLNACFVRSISFSRLQTVLELVKQEEISTFNLCNLATLTYKLQIQYESEQVLDLVDKMLSFIQKLIPEAKFVQNKVLNGMEYDCCPLTCLLEYDEDNTTLKIHNMLLDQFKFLGYDVKQVYDILDYTRNMTKVLPSDLIAKLPIVRKETLVQYVKIKELMNC